MFVLSCKDFANCDSQGLKDTHFPLESQQLENLVSHSSMVSSDQFHWFLVPPFLLVGRKTVPGNGLGLADQVTLVPGGGGMKTHQFEPVVRVESFLEVPLGMWHDCLCGCSE